MKKIEGIDLGQELTTAYVEVLEDQKHEVRRKIRGIVNDFTLAQATTEKAQKALDKDRETEAKLGEKITKIKAGDWSVLADESVKSEGKKDKSDSDKQEGNY